VSTSAVRIGVVGLGYWGPNLARNFARHGHTVAVHNRSYNRTKELVEEFGQEGTFLPAESAEDFVASLERPRRVVIMVKAGDPTKQELYEQAREAGIEGRSSMNKDELADAVRGQDT